MKPWKELKEDSRFSRLDPRKSNVLLLDYDGTLAPFTSDRDNAVPYPGVRNLLEDIHSSSSTRLVFVSGRDVQTLLRLLDLSFSPEIWGSHGGEHLCADGTVEPLHLCDSQRSGMDRARAVAADVCDRLGLSGRVEEKTGGVALHFRGLSPHSAHSLRDSVRPLWAGLAADSSLDLHTFDGGLELRVPGMDKGRAVRAVLADLGDAVREVGIFYLGDDLTDEDAFSALEGQGVSILVRGEARASLAEFHLHPPFELLEFLKHWRMRTGGAG